MSDLRERVARAIRYIYNEDTRTPVDKPSMVAADAAIAIVLEEAAKRADREKFTSDTLTPSGEAHNRACDIIAAALRAYISGSGSAS